MKKIKLNKILQEGWKKKAKDKNESRSELKEFLEDVSNFNSFNETVYRNKDLKAVTSEIKDLVEYASQATLTETEEWFDKVTVNRHMKQLKESYRIFEQTSKEISQLQARLENAYEDVGGILNKYYDIKPMQEGNAFGKAVSDAKKKGDKTFKVGGKEYKVK